MDWLAPHHYVLDCYAKTVTLAKQRISPVVEQGSVSRVPMGIILYIEAQRLRYVRCLPYLAYNHDVIDEAPLVESVLVVCEFPDVFPADLPGLPPNRDVDFVIEVDPSTKRISIPPYRMTAATLKEPSKKVQGLFDLDS